MRPPLLLLYLTVNRQTHSSSASPRHLLVLSQVFSSSPCTDIGCHRNLQYFLLVRCPNSSDAEVLSPTRYRRIEHLLPRSVVCKRLVEANWRNVNRPATWQIILQVYYVTADLTLVWQYVW